MKIKTIEKVVNIKELFAILKQQLNSKFNIDDMSFVGENSIFLIAKDKKSRFIQVVAFKYAEFKRTIIYILMMKNKPDLSKLKRKVDSGSEIKPHDFFNFLNSIEKANASKKKKIEFNELEEKILNKILKKLRVTFDQKDKLLKYPFSLTGNITFDADLHLKYSKFLDIIERNFIQYGIKPSQLFRYYDFAKTSEFYQRIIDLVVVSDKIIDESATHWILFIYSNKTKEKFKLLELVKLFGEISKYSKIIHKKLKSKKIIKPALVILSASGFEKSLPNYLRNHLYGEFEHISPIFVIPPCAQNVWHNLNEDRSLTAELQHRKKEIKMKISRLRKIVNPAPYRKEQIDSEAKILSDIKERIEAVEKNYKLINIFSEILPIKIFYQIFDLKPEKPDLKHKVKESKELLFI